MRALLVLLIVFSLATGGLVAAQPETAAACWGDCEGSGGWGGDSDYSQVNTNLYYDWQEQALLTGQPEDWAGIYTILGTIAAEIAIGYLIWQYVW